MNERSTKRSVVFAFGMLIVLMICFAAVLASGVVSASAEGDGSFTGYSSTLSEKELYEATNTYAYNGANPYDIRTEEGRLYEYFNVSGNPASVAISDTPQITVLTHGLGGSAAHWSNQSGTLAWSDDIAFDFAYSPNSLISKIDEQLLGGEALIYWAKMTGHNEFSLVDLKNHENKNANGTYKNDDLSQPTIKTVKLSDVSKHIIIIFEATSAGANGYNNETYEEFNYMLSKIVYDVKYLSGKLPKINLIGHSRGGITNLQYALDHPDLVAGVFSMGTPYFGTDTGSTVLGEQFCAGSLKGLSDIITRKIYTSYYNRYNNGRNSYYKNIEFHALGGYSDLEYLVTALTSDQFDVVEPQYKAALGILLGIDKWSPMQVQNINALADIVDFVASLFRGVDYSESEFESWVQIVSDLSMFDPYSGDFWDNVVHAFVPYAVSHYFMNDTLVDLTSQLGVDEHSNTYRSYEFKTYTKKFDDEDAVRLSARQPAVVHNLEAQDASFINYIVCNIEVGSGKSGFVYDVKSDGSCVIYGYRGSVNGISTFEIPSQLDGYTVTEIGAYAFSDIFANGSTTQIIFPATVTSIGKYAFCGCSDLQTIAFASGAQLKEVKEAAFAGCSSLSTFTLPTPVTQIGLYAFGGTNIASFRVGANMSHIDDRAFLNCSNFKNFTQVGTNPYYLVSNGILYNKNKTELISYPEGKQTTSFTLPSSVASVGEYAVYVNDSLASTNLNNATTIREYAFSNCANLVNIGANKVEYVGSGALEGTKWLDNAPDKVVIGKALYQYNGTASNLDLSGLYSISPFAVCDNANLQTVTMNNAARTIDTYAFFGCENLNTVYINNVNSIVYVGTGAFDATGENLTIYIPQRIANQYENNDLWQQYENELEVHSTYIDYELNGGEFSEADYNDSVEYGGYFSLPVPEKEGYSFKGWYDSSDFSGAPRAEGELWTEYDDTITLYAKWEILENVYTVTYQLNGGSMETTTDTFTENDTFTYPIPERYGYVFQGWFYDSDFDQYAGTFCPTGVKENIVLYAKWVEQYYIDFRYGYSHDNPVFFIEEDLPLKLTSAERSGYRFMGWYTSSVFAPEYKVIEITEPQNIKLYAYWEKLYTVTFNTNGGSSVPSVQGIAGERIKLPSPTRYQYEGTWEAWGYLTKDVSVSNFGYSYTIERKDVTLDAIWRRVVYNVYFKNLASNMYVPTTTYRVGVGLNQLPNIVFRGAGAHGEDVPLSNFYGWYDSSDFSGEPVQSIGKSEARNITLYAKYDYLIKTAFKTGSSKVQDTGINQQPSYSFNVNMNMYYNYVKNTTLDTIKVTVSLTIWEDQDGYQDVYVYNGDQELAMKTFEHGEGVTNTTPGPHTHDFTFELNSYKDIDQLTIRFGAHGAFGDTWNFSDLEVRVYLTN